MCTRRTRPVVWFNSIGLKFILRDTKCVQNLRLKNKLTCGFWMYDVFISDSLSWIFSVLCCTLVKLSIVPKILMILCCTLVKLSIVPKILMISLNQQFTPRFSATMKHCIQNKPYLRQYNQSPCNTRLRMINATSESTVLQNNIVAKQRYKGSFTNFICEGNLVLKQDILTFKSDWAKNRKYLQILSRKSILLRRLNPSVYSFYSSKSPSPMIQCSILTVTLMVMLVYV